MINSSAILTKAFVRAVKLLKIDSKALSNVLAVDEFTVSRLLGGDYQFSIDRQNEWRTAVELVRLYQLLDAMFSEVDSAAHWLNGYNSALEAEPLHLIQSMDGIIRVNIYLQAHLAKI